MSETEKNIQQEVVVKEKKKRNRKVFSKKDLIKIMQEKHLSDLGLSNRFLSGIVDSFLEAYKEAILTNKRVELAHFGTIRRELMKGKILRHPSSRVESIASPYYRMSFKPTRELRDLLRAKALEEIKKTEG